MPRLMTSIGKCLCAPHVTAPRDLNALHSNPDNLWAALLYIGMRGEPESGIHPGVNFYLEDPRFPLEAVHNIGFRVPGGGS